MIAFKQLNVTHDNFPPKHHRLEIREYIQIALFAFLFTVGSFVNLVSFVYFGFRKTRFKSNYRYFIAHLSLADLLCCLTTPVFITSLLVNQEIWVFGDFTCRFIYPLSRLMGILSAWILCGMTYERCRAFTNPFKKLRKRTIQIFLAVVWFVVISYSMTYSLTVSNVDPKHCIITGLQKTAYLNLIKSNIKIGVPSVVIIILCVRLMLFLRVNKNTEIHTSTSSADNGNQTTNNSQTRLQRRTDKSEKMILQSAASYLVCVLPLYVAQILSNVIIMLEIPKDRNITRENMRWIIILFYANSVVNVFIYAGRFKDFQKFIIQTLTFYKCK